MRIRIKLRNTEELAQSIRIQAERLRAGARYLAARIQPVVHSRRFLVPTAIAVGLCAIFAGWFLFGIYQTIPDASALRNIGTMPQASVLLDAGDQPVFTIFREQRIKVPLKSISPNVVRALVAFEDQRFYDHKGLNLVRLAGAAVSNLQEGRKAQGASTLTQQLARQTFLTPDKTIRRKVTEIFIAAWLEHMFTKDEILELYLNKVYFGDGLYGIEAASLGYFGKHAADLDVSEAALLVGLLKAPSTHAPTQRMDRAMTRRNLVLRAMRDVGAIDAATHQRAVRTPVELTDALRVGEHHGQYFKEEVREELVRLFGQERVYQGGLKVYTTFDLDMQKAAEAEVARTLAEIEQRKAQRGRQGDEDGDPLQAALVAMDAHTGEVRALVGGRNFEQSGFNRATEALRQSGSAFKPFVYAAALESGYSPATLLTNLDEPTMTPQGAWVPEDEHLESPAMTIRTALRTSSNRAAVQMLNEVGISTAVRYAGQLGLESIPGVPSLALGSGEVTLMAMTAAYGAFANEGILPEPALIRRVEDVDGQVLFTAKTSSRRAVSASTAFLMTTMLADVINSGTAWPARRVGFMLPAAGKTGTTNDYRDAWFIGYTPSLVAGVWIGYDRPKTIIRDGYAGELAVPLWGRFMMAATKKDKAQWFRPPYGITSATICRLSGQLPTDSCRDAEVLDAEGNPTNRAPTYTEFFVRGTEPTGYCPLHGRFDGEDVVVVGNHVPRMEPLVIPRSGPAVVTGGVLPQPDPPAAQPEPARKRGFWGRLFGFGGNQRDRNDRKQ